MKTAGSLLSLMISVILIQGCFVNSDDPIHPRRNEEIQKDSSDNPNYKNAVFPADSISCFKILIDASKDGGAWWFPQGVEIFNPDLDHQGIVFAQILRNEGYQVDELGRDQQITDAILNNYNIIIRANGFESYSQNELDAYKNALERGITLLLLSDHKKYDPVDELDDMLNIHFTGVVEGTVTKFAEDPVTRGMNNLDYFVGSYIANAQSQDIVPLAWLKVDSKDEVVMGYLKHPKSRIFFLGETNTLELIPQPLTQNLMDWIARGCGNNGNEY